MNDGGSSWLEKGATRVYPPSRDNGTDDFMPRSMVSKLHYGAPMN